MNIYAENLRGRDSAYVITEALLRSVVDLEVEARVTVQWSDDPDFSALADADVFVGGGFDQKRLAKHASRLLLVHSTSAGVERYLPLDWLPPQAAFTNSSGIHAAKAREYITWALPALHAGLPRFAQAQRESRWNRKLTGLMADKHVVVLGLGGLGAAVAEAARAIGLRVTAVTRSGKPSPMMRVFPIAQLNAVLPTADFLVLACPLTPNTRGLIDARAIARLPPTASIVNIARGPVVDTTALCEALRQGRLAGALLDVFDVEPLPKDSPIWDTPGLLVTPHVSCDTPDYIFRSLQILGRNVKRLREGLTSQLENQVDAQLGY